MLRIYWRFPVRTISAQHYPSYAQTLARRGNIIGALKLENPSPSPRQEIKVKRQSLAVLLDSLVISGDDAETLRTKVLNNVLLATVAMLAIFVIGSLLGSRLPAAVIALEVGLAAACLLLRLLLPHRRTKLASALFLAGAFLVLTAAVARVGTIRVPATGFYMVLIVAAGFFFSFRGLFAAIGLSSLAVAGLIVAENSGLLPPSAPAVTLTQWVTTLALFGSAGFWTIVILQTIRSAHLRVDAEVAERKRNETRLRLALEAAGQSWFELDLRSGAVVTSADYPRLLGYDPATFSSNLTNWLANIHPADRPGLQEMFTRCLASGNTLSVEYRRQTATGDWRWLQSVGRVVEFDASGKPALMAGTHSDITARKQGEEALRQTQVQLTSAMDQARLAYWEMDAATRTFTFNDRFYALYATTAEREGGYQMAAEKYAREFLPPEDQHLVPADLTTLLSGATDGLQLEHRIRRRDGEIRQIVVRITVIHDATGRVLSTRGSNQDVTDLRRAESALRASDERFHQLADNITDVFWITSPDFKTMHYVSPGYERIWGRSVASLYTRPHQWAEAIVPEDQAGVSEALAGLAEDKPTASVEYRIAHADGSRRWISDRAFQVRDTAGKVIRLTGIASDITDRKQAESARNRLEAINRRLQKSESLGRMAGAIAHHFNNQLQAVILNLEMAALAHTPDAPPVEGFSRAVKSAQKAAEVSTLMLTYLGQSQEKHEPLDLAAVCSENLSLLRAAMPNGILETELPSPGPIISANANQLRQALTNLVTNAFEACRSGREVIRLSVRTVAAANVPTARRFPIDFSPQAAVYACLEVMDQGSGISAENIEKLFEPFFSTKFAGRGMGLPVVLGIARSHSGVVTVESDPGQGSTFRIYFPLSADPIPPKVPRAEPVPVATSVRPDAMVLVVDDEPIVRETINLVLKRAGFLTLVAEDGVAALSVVQQHRESIGCVVCDLTMPRMNGWETLTALRQLVPGIPIILASGYSEAQVMSGAHAELPQAFLHKPYDAESLMNAIRPYLPPPSPP